MCWFDERIMKNTFDIYAQRIDKDGFVRWTVNGIAICAAIGSQAKPEIVSDDAGGAIIVWTDTRSGNNDLYAQRVDSSGNVLWTPDGVPVVDATYDQGDHKITTDGRHGVIVIWCTTTGGLDTHIYAQRLDAAGNRMWGQQAAVCTGFISQNKPCVASDGSGGAYCAWAHSKKLGEYDIYAQRLDSNGAAKWTNNGISIASGNGAQDAPMLCADGAGNGFLTYLDFGGASIANLHLAILKKDGTTAASYRVTSTSGGQSNSRMWNIAPGSVAIAWEDARVSGKVRSYAQIISSTGAKSWAADGIAVSNRAGDQVSPFVTSDGNGGVIAAWEDKTKSALETDIVAQRISSSGSLQWTDAGVAICTAANSQQYPQLVPDGQNGAILAWEDYRPSFSNAEIYAARILADGSFPIGPPVLTFSSKSVACGSVAVGSSTTKSITLTNIGGTAVTIASVTSSDPQFTLTPANNTVAPSGNVTASVKYQPTAKGAASARIVIQSNSITGPDTVSVTGTGTATTAIQVDKSTLAFGNVKLGAGKTLAVKITNSGNDTLQVSNVVSSSPRFTVAITSRVLAPGASFDDSIRFSPVALGAVTGNLTITSNAPTSPTTVSLTGTGAPEITMTVNHRTIAFGDVVVGAHRDTTVTLTNTGNDSLRISAFTAGNARFTLETPVTVIAPAGVKTVTLRFTPSMAGLLNSFFTVTSNALSSPDTIAVSGNGVVPAAIAFAPTELHFDSVAVGSNKTLVLTINNGGNQKLTVTSITSTNADFNALVGQFEVSGGGTYNDMVRFTPSVLGDRSGYLIIASNAPTSPDSVAVDGIGKLLVSVPELRVSPGAFTLYRNYPNPFRPSTTIRYDLETAASVRLTVHNTLGQTVATLVDEPQTPGTHSVQWTPAGNAPGVYLYVLRVGATEAYGRMVVAK
jgi:hypothetical protein